MQTAYSPGRKAVILGGLFMAWILAYADRIAMSISIIPITKEFSLTAAQSGYILSSFYITYSLMQLGGGWLSDRFGSRGVLVFCIASWSVFTSLTGVAWSFVSLMIARLLFGIGEGGFSPASSVTIAESFPVKERARAKSFVISSVTLGNVMGTGLIATVIAYDGWRSAYHALGAIGLVFAVALWFALYERKAPGAARSVKPQVRFMDVLRRSMVRKITLIIFLTNIVSLGLQSWMPSYLMKRYNIDILHIGLLSAAPYVLGFFAINLTGWLLDHVGKGRERLLMSLATGFKTLFLVLMISTNSLVMLVVFSTLAGMAHSVVFATIYAIPLKHLPDEIVGTATGIMNFGGQLAGAVAPAVMGVLIAQFNQEFLPAFLFLVASGVLSCLVSLTWSADAPATGADVHAVQTV